VSGFHGPEGAVAHRLYYESERGAMVTRLVSFARGIPDRVEAA